MFPSCFSQRVLASQERAQFGKENSAPVFHFEDGIHYIILHDGFKGKMFWLSLVFVVKNIYLVQFCCFLESFFFFLDFFISGSGWMNSICFFWFVAQSLHWFHDDHRHVLAANESFHCFVHLHWGEIHQALQAACALLKGTVLVLVPVSVCWHR